MTTNGPEFRLDGKPFFFQGTNYFQGGLERIVAEQQVYNDTKALAAQGLKVIRVWGFSCGAGYDPTDAMIPSFTASGPTYNEAAFARLDAAIDAARAAGLKVIMPFVNFEADLCGMVHWVSGIMGTPVASTDKQLFYTNDTIKRLFKAHIAMMLNRVNTKYKTTLGMNIMYKDDPTFFSFEAANEPHTEDNYESKMSAPAGAIVNTWLGEITTYIRSVDHNHMISTGEEGYRVNGSTTGMWAQNSWIHNGLKGVDFDKDVALPDVSFATVHIYPDNLNIPATEMPWIRDYLVKDRAAISHAAGKPILMEESGFNTDPTWHLSLGYYSNAAGYLGKMYQFANDAQYAGTMVWQAIPTWGNKADYQFGFTDARFAVVKAQAKCLNSKSAGGNDCADINAY